VPHHPAVELRHHPVVLEHRQELPGRHQRALFLAQAHQHFRHRVALVAGELQDRLAVQLELVALDRVPQAPDRVGPARELGIHALEKRIGHGAEF